MTATLTRTEPTNKPVIDTGSAAFRTVLVMIGCLLASLPLLGLFERGSWLADAWPTMILTLGPAALLRIRRPARAWQLLPGLVLAVLWITARFLDQHALLGFIPTPATGGDVSTLFGQLGDIIRQSSVPIPPAPPAVFVLCLVLAVFAGAVDLLAIVARRAALAGIPMLVVYVVSGAIMRSSVHWLLFAGAAAGFLLMLTVNARDEFGRWGPLVPRVGEDGSRASLGVSGQRIGVLGIVCALVLAAIAPTRAGNALSDVFGGNGGGGDLFGIPDGGTQIDPFASLKGQLVEPRATPLVEVTVRSSSRVDPFYLRTEVLTEYDENGWHQGDEGPNVVLRDNGYYTNPRTDTSGLPRQTFLAQMKVINLSGAPAIFGQPQAIRGFGNGASWLPDLGLVSTKVTQGGTYTETVQQPNPTSDYLNAVDGAQSDPEAVQAPDFPSSVSQLVTRLTAGAATRYAKARAISDYFTDDANGFTYSLETKAGDSGNDLVDFLQNKTGFCQQYAAAMGIMLLMAGIPARVVLGYTHGPLVSGSFTVNSTDAHAWVEAFLPGAGWTSFDPTPITGGAGGGATTNLPWAPHPDTAVGPGTTATGQGGPSNNKTAGNPDLLNAGTASAQAPTAAASSGGSHWPAWGTLLIVLILVIAAAVPALVRRRRRWSRLRAGRDGDTDALWAELSATAEDLGYVWSSARTPRQVVSWLADGSDGESLRELAGAVESARYAPSGASTAVAPAELVSDLRAVEAGLRSQRTRWARWRAVLLPHSLRWPLPGQQHTR